MERFQVLFIKEHVHNEVNRLDHRICILYDPTEEKFFYYGSRNNNAQNMYVDYEGYYSYDQLDSFVLFLRFIMSEFDEVLTTELHYVKIPPHQYTGLTYTRLLDKMSNKTLMAAYDRNKENRYSIELYLKMLVPV
jgi:hypothetical protein